MTAIEQWCVAHGWPAPWVVVLVAMLPVAELRGAIPLALWGFRLDPWASLGWALLGNLLIVPPVVFFLEPLYQWLRRFRIGRRFTEWCERHARRRAAIVERLELVGLALFVAVPLPGTGAWTGALVASLCRFQRWRACGAIAAGVVVAGLVVLAGAVGVEQLVHRLR